MLVVLVLLVVLVVLGLALMYIGRDHHKAERRAATRPKRFYNPEQFSPFPLMPRRRVPIPARSRLWQVGLALYVYSFLGVVLLGVIWFFRQLP